MSAWAMNNPGKVALLQETTAQHFPVTGSYVVNTTFDKCAPMSPGTSQHNFVAEQNRVVHRIAKVFERYVGVVPIYDLTAPRWDMHHGGGDCTHLCYTPVFFDRYFTQVYDAIELWMKKRRHDR